MATLIRWPVPLIFANIWPMAMNDEETVALVAGGHTFGKAHGAGDGGCYAERKQPLSKKWALAGLVNMDLAKEAMLLLVVLRLDCNPTKWDNGYFDLLLGYEWSLQKVQLVRIFGMRLTQRRRSCT